MLETCFRKGKTFPVEYCCMTKSLIIQNMELNESWKLCLSPQLEPGKKHLCFVFTCLIYNLLLLLMPHCCSCKVLCCIYKDFPGKHNFSYNSQASTKIFFYGGYKLYHRIALGKKINVLLTGKKTVR